MATLEPTAHIQLDHLRVSEPKRSPGSKKVRAVITFEPRTSVFDTTNEHTGKNEFRGFFTLFWISIFLLTVQNYITSFERNGYPLSLAFATMFSRNAFTLALSDAVLVASTGLSVLFVKAVQKGWIRYYYTGVIIHHSFQTLMLACAVTWTFNRKWYWVQSGFFTLHSLVMIMKVHSYCAVNGYLSWVSLRAAKVQNELEAAATEASGSYEAALSAAAGNKPASPGTNDVSGAGTPSIDGHNIGDTPLAAALRNRLLNGNANGPDVHVLPTHHEEHPLVHHPDGKVAQLAQKLSECESELTSDGKDHVRWPANVSLANFVDYQLIPTLVYELEYPRTPRIRPLYVLEKTVATFGTFALLYTVTEHSIIPLIPSPGSEYPFWRSVLDLALPFMMAYVLLFYIIFECICNGFAELSRFADRRFYDDWWNSTSQDEFARKWNRPVHMFLLRHVYASTMAEYKLSKHSATLITFLLSACVHELVMLIVTKKIRMYLFVMQMAQIPLIALGRIPAIKRNRILGNIVFWIGLYCGFPLLCVGYCTY
ncbi:MBOAT-domain-containing protein [Exidia glandulosa HHB12029]|uniref:O-acyltransferase n=1 Tax=Exidia glandulosa HHB12029 TaxID=1314781 RepID=A0A165JAV5_EXIGL|nr:MBOAT-domain-containing protein [Exidia glandulosa HHB12029]